MRRLIAFPLVVWVLGYIWFVVALPTPLGNETTDAIVVPTGGQGRIARGLDLVENKVAPVLLVTGVDPEVKPGEFAAEYDVSMQRMDCCVTLGFAAVDTHTNALEAAAWLNSKDAKTVRIVTSDWHMRRAAGEFGDALPEGVTMIEDAVQTEPSFKTLFLEYNKYIVSKISRLWPE
ncbi:YdcF family protein [Altererythrobacter aquiaggeris]|uniref:YdcF family protein n=1 Tax=Aestuarierythrobacter aquiaggeris TaxID=1898396 RepID=UPI00301992B9